MNDENLIEDILKFKEINILAIKAVAEGNIDEFVDLFEEFARLKRKIKRISIEHSVVKVNDIKAKEILRKINSNELFEFDNIINAFENGINGPINIFSLTEDEIEKLARDHFYSWFSGYDYVENLYKIGSLILGIDIPDKLKTIISETRKCLALEQYNATYSLCRTLLEASILDICKIIRYN